MQSVPWDLRRRGLQDSRRHDERVRDALRKNLRHLITEEAIITSDEQRLIKVPIRYLDQYRFRYSDEEEGGGGAGQGEGAPGDRVVQEAPDEAPGDQPGDRPGEAIYEAEFSVEELARMMLEELQLPWLEERRTPLEESVAEQVRDVRRTGPWPNLDKRRTLYQNLKRQAAKGAKRVGPFVDDDLRFRTWDERTTPRTQAAIYMLMDRSGSMTSEKRYIAKCFYFWLVRFLRMKYQGVDLIFIAHDASAEITDEAAFFTISNHGGTRCSSALELALAHMRDHHPPSRWNNYLFHFSDGDNLNDDNERCIELTEVLLDHCQMLGFGEITCRDWPSFYHSRASEQKRRRSSLFEALDTIDHPHLVLVDIERRSQVYHALQAFLARDGAST